MRFWARLAARWAAWAWSGPSSTGPLWHGPSHLPTPHPLVSPASSGHLSHLSILPHLLPGKAPPGVPRTHLLIQGNPAPATLFWEIFWGSLYYLLGPFGIGHCEWCVCCTKCRADRYWGTSCLSRPTQGQNTSRWIVVSKPDCARLVS